MQKTLFAKNMQCAEIYGHVEWLQGCECVDAATGLRDNVTVAVPRTGVGRVSCMGRLILTCVMSKGRQVPKVFVAAFEAVQTSTFPSQPLWSFSERVWKL